MENNEKKLYEEPVVEKVEFKFSDRITASSWSPAPPAGPAGTC